MAVCMVELKNLLIFKPTRNLSCSLGQVVVEVVVVDYLIFLPVTGELRENRDNSCLSSSVRFSNLRCCWSRAGLRSTRCCCWSWSSLCCCCPMLFCCCRALNNDGVADTTPTTTITMRTTSCLQLIIVIMFA